MAADLRKLCDIDALALENIAEITARANDEGVHTIFDGWLNRATSKDALMVLSVGGGTAHVSEALVHAIEEAKAARARVYGIVGPDGGYTARHADLVIRVPVENRKHITPHTEAFQSVICHCLVSHPVLQKHRTTW
jgi:D-sedoheptulose 7-phosphate isomerase